MSGCHPTYICLCSCHKGGPKYMRTSNPPKPCCDCDKIEYHSDNAVSPLVEQIQLMKDRINLLEKTQLELIDKIAEIANFYYREKKEPYKCPVCEGKRIELNIMPNGCYFESSCKTCDGKGIVWK